jgi:predicted homoserine dehydrogenase-like protein
MLLCRAEGIDVVVELTGSVELGAHVVLEAAKHGKHSVLMNAEVDATIGPILSVHAEKAGVIMSACDGDEPGLQMNLVRYVEGLGLTPRVIGNVKGLQDPYRNPDTQKGFAEKWGQNPAMVTSFADGSKISFEQTIVANATGAKVLQRGMSRGREFHGSPLELPSLYDVDQVRELGSVIDYTVGPANVKIFVLAEHDDPKQRHYLKPVQDGRGSAVSRSGPRTTCRTSRPRTRSRASSASATTSPSRSAVPSVEVCAVAKARPQGGRDAGRLRHVHDLRRGRQRRGDVRAAPPALRALVEGCKLIRDVPKDQVVTYDDVELPAGRLADRLRAEQYRHFFGETWLEELLLVPTTEEGHIMKATSVGGRSRSRPRPARDCGGRHLDGLGGTVAVVDGTGRLHRLSGERNDVTARELTIGDAGAPVGRGRRPCAQLDAHTVSCSEPPFAGTPLTALHRRPQRPGAARLQCCGSSRCEGGRGRMP